MSGQIDTKRGQFGKEREKAGSISGFYGKERVKNEE